MAVAVPLYCVGINKTEILIYEVEKENIFGLQKPNPRAGVQHHKHWKSLRSDPTEHQNQTPEPGGYRNRNRPLSQDLHAGNAAEMPQVSEEILNRRRLKIQSEKECHGKMIFKWEQ